MQYGEQVLARLSQSQKHKIEETLLIEILIREGIISQQKIFFVRISHISAIEYLFEK